ncbi:MAG TPA: FAD-dependent monooxygenase [Candidatus Babeliales bacterium]|nr:FAD-dependent monooxygenase [Candidatus Babeliales bacterium]
MDKHIPVLIVGAGPTGLMMACELARYGVPFRIVDKKLERTLASNATWVQTRTLELFNQIGILDRFLHAGHRCDAINLYSDGKYLTKLSLNYIDSLYPFILMLPQSETERLLGEYLKELHGQIEWSAELIEVKCDSKIVESNIRSSTGDIETITSDWLIACDGANSIIREKCGFHFPGEDLTEQFVVADAKIDFSYMSKDEIHLFFDPGTIFAAFPLGSNKYRIAANLHLDYPRKIFTEREVIEIVQERAHGKYYVTDVGWISPFWIHGKLVEHMRHDRIFLVGDAAHIHSPAGGQGMNTGLQDAFNLAWKLALVIKGKATLSLLDSYHSERFPIVKQAVDQNEYFTKMALFDDTFLTKLNHFSKTLSHDQKSLSKQIGEQITQIDIQYQTSPIIKYEETVNSHAPKPGKRAPDVVINQSSQLYHYLRNTKHNVLIFTGLEDDDSIKIKDLKKQIDQTYSNLVKTHCISKDKITDLDDFILDENNILHESYRIKKPTIYIVRPDGYIAYCSTRFNFSSVENLLDKYLYKDK